MNEDLKSKLDRPVHKVPKFVQESLKERKLDKAYRERPPYQRNDYIGWIMEAKREETRHKRLNQMLDELESGDRYMKMEWRSGQQ